MPAQEATRTVTGGPPMWHLRGTCLAGYDFVPHTDRASCDHTIACPQKSQLVDELVDYRKYSNTYLDEGINCLDKLSTICEYNLSICCIFTLQLD